MIGYGTHTVFKLQFPFPSLARLMEPYGDSSPMALLWTFMGYSTAYSVFSGAAETLGGLLVFFRRTTMLGALMLMAVLVNIVMMNFCYDVPVKLFSSNLLLMSIFLLAPDLKRLATFLVLNRATQPVPPAPTPRQPWLRHGRRAVQILFVAWIVFLNIKNPLALRKQFGDHSPTPPLYGAYDVEELVKNGVTLPPLLTDSQRWRTVFITGSRDRIFLAGKTMDGTSPNFAIENHTPRPTLTLTPRHSGP